MNTYIFCVQPFIEGHEAEQVKLFCHDSVSSEELEFISSMNFKLAEKYCSTRGWKLVHWPSHEQSSTEK